MYDSTVKKLDSVSGSFVLVTVVDGGILGSLLVRGGGGHTFRLFVVGLAESNQCGGFVQRC